MNERLFTISQIATHLACFVVSFYITWPIIQHLVDFSGFCALFSCGTFNEEDGRFEPKWASCGMCYFAAVIGVYTSLYSFVQIILKSRMFYYNSERTFKIAAIDFLSDSLFVLMILLCSILVSTGLYKWCGCVTQRFNTCEIASSVMEISYKNSTIVAKNFSVQLETVQFAIWILFVCSSLQLMLSTKRALIIHEQENLVVSMARERLRYQNSNSYS